MSKRLFFTHCFCEVQYTESLTEWKKLECTEVIEKFLQSSRTRFLLSPRQKQIPLPTQYFPPFEVKILVA